MPELPEVETVKESLKARLIGKKIKSVKVLYDNIIEYPLKQDFINNISGEVINDIKRRGKWLMFELDNYYLLSHLRMEGKYFFKSENEEINRHEHVIFVFEDEELRYHDTRKFGKMLLIEKDQIMKIGPIASLGLEPWDKDLTVDYLKKKLKVKRIPIKTSLLDQNIISGIGNIYANEILYLSGINPMLESSRVSDEMLEKLIENTKIVLEKAISLGGSTIKSYSSVDGASGLFQNELNVHGKEHDLCPKCQSEILKIKIGGRGTYYCPKCQKVPENKSVKKV